MRNITILMVILSIGLQSCKKHHINTYIKIEDEASNGVCSYWDDNPCLPYGFTYGQSYGPCTDQKTFMSFNYQICNGHTFSGSYYFQPSNEEITNDKDIEADFTLHLTNNGIEPGLYVGTVTAKTDETTHPSEYTVYQNVKGGVLIIHCKEDTNSKNFQPYLTKVKR